MVGECHSPFNGIHTYLAVVWLKIIANVIIKRTAAGFKLQSSQDCAQHTWES